MKKTPTLEHRLQAQIASSGPLSIEAFMARALYDPNDGYYYQKIPIGRDGDYITAPEMTQVFGEVIALWLVDLWHQAGNPTPFHLVEMGPGRGTLMVDILRTFITLKIPLSEMSVHLVEISPLLTNMQQTALSSFPVHVQWYKDFSEIPKNNGFCLMIGNEFWDALPIQQWVQVGQDWVERHIDWQEDKFVFLPQTTEALREACPAMETLVPQIADYLKAHTGVALFLDYGYDEEQALGDTLQAVYHHHSLPPLSQVGKADLTHHVNFHRLKTLFQEADLNVDGPIPQGDFLKALGFEARTERLCEQAQPHQRGSLRTAAVRLTHPAHMGTLFKAFTVSSFPTLQPAGFFKGK